MKFNISNLKSQILKNLSLIVVLLLAAFYRLYKIQDYMTFLGDEGRDVLVVYNLLHGKLTLLGPTSSVGGFFLGPIYYYFMAPFLFLFNYNPVGPAIMVALIGIATVFLIYKICENFFNKRVAFFAAIIYAISPLVVSYSRSSWNPNPLPFFSLLSLLSVYKALQKNSLKLFLATGVLLGISMQLHYLAIFLCAVIFLYVSFTTVYKSLTKSTFVSLIKRYLLLLIGFLFGWSPFIAFEIRHGFPDFRSIYDFILHSGNTGPGASFFSTIQDVFFRIFGRLVFAYPQADHFYLFSKEVINIWTVFVILVALLSTSFLIINFYKSLKNKNDNFYKYSLLFFWFFAGILLFGLYKKSIYDYYFAFMFPLPFIMFGLLLDWAVKNKTFLFGYSKYLASIVFVIIILINLAGIPFRYPANRQLNQMKTIADFVMTQTNAKPFNFALITGGNSDHAYKYFFTVWNHPPTTIDYPGIDPERKTATDQLFVVCETLPCHPVGNSLWEIAGFGQAEIAGKWSVSVVEIYKLIPYKEK